MTLDEASKKNKDKYKTETALKDISHTQREIKNTDTHIPMVLHGQNFFHPILSP